MTDRRAIDLATSRPLLDTRPDMERYVERSVDALLVDGVNRGLNVLLEGPRGSGKTTSLSRLRWLMRQQPEQLKEAVMVRGRLATSTSSFLYLLLEAISKRPDAAAAGPRGGMVQTSTLADGPPEHGIDELLTWRELATTQGALRVLRNSIEHVEHPLVFLVDDLDPVLANQVFGVLRDDLWELGVQWVVTSVEEGTQILLAPPADAFFDLTVQMRPLTRSEAHDLVKLRTGRELEVPNRIYMHDDAWQPRDLLRVVALADPEQWESLTQRRAWQQSEISKLGRPASMLAEILRALGPVSPSDERVLNQTGWTRSRVSQVLRQLLEAGHVSYTEAPTGRAGRPARLYRLHDPGAQS